jgi:exopolysaccharide biosynthesis polyprenyl glycosylphosphotransferase
MTRAEDAVAGVGLRAPALGGVPQLQRAGDQGGAGVLPTVLFEPVVASAAAPGNMGVGTLRPVALWLREWGLHVEVFTAFGAGVAAALAVSSQPYVALLALVAWMLGNYHRGRAVTTPLTQQLRWVAGSALLPFSAVAAGVGFGGLPATEIRASFAAVSAGIATSVLCRSLRWRLQAPVRVVVVGERAAVATAISGSARTSGMRVVGGMLVEPDLPAHAAPHAILGVPTVAGLDSARGLVSEVHADVVVVHCGAAMTSQMFRRLTWDLEAMNCNVGVMGLTDSVAPHRLTPGSLGRRGILYVRQPRPSTVTRSLKAAVDRLLAGALLVFFAPLLLAMVLAVRADTRGPALFKQTRVGRHGKLFTVYKMRTMVHGAEALKHDLARENEFDSVLFKMRSDPRTTRVGAFLRRTSLDEFPQLLNVVKGDMSLVGPRPHLPEEIAAMDTDTLRRLAVRPGITGLWQVSGRSDLTFREAAALDTYYADNWSLAGDLAICAQTPRAVVSGRGAY